MAHTKQIAVIGCGARSVRLMELLAGTPGLTIKGEYDPIPERVDRLPHGSRAPQRYRGYEEAAADEAVDWVVFGSPNAAHKEQILAAFEAGKHVFAEKTLATSVAGIGQLQQLSNLGLRDNPQLSTGVAELATVPTLSSADFFNSTSIPAQDTQAVIDAHPTASITRPD